MIKSYIISLEKIVFGGISNISSIVVKVTKIMKKLNYDSVNRSILH